VCVAQAKQERMYCSVRTIITADKPIQFVIAAWKKTSILNTHQVFGSSGHQMVLNEQGEIRVYFPVHKENLRKKLHYAACYIKNAAPIFPSLLSQSCEVYPYEFISRDSNRSSRFGLRPSVQEVSYLYLHESSIT